jgi:glycosyltransferase involved in cell wall biosynthesis
MRILLVHNFYRQPGGEDTVVYAEKAQLEASGHQVYPYFIYNDSIKSISDKLKTFMNVTYNVKSKSILANIIKTFQPDLMHVHNFFPLLSPSIFDAAQEAGIPSLLTLHNFRILCPTATLYHNGRIQERSLTGASWWTVWQRTYRNSLFGTLAVARMVEYHKKRGTWRTQVDRFIALTPFAQARFVLGGLPVERIVIKPNGAPSPILPAPADEVQPRAGVLFVGRLCEEKGILPLVRLWRDLGVTLTVVGDGPLRPHLLAEAGPDVRLLGQLDAAGVQDEMRKAALLILPSLYYEMLPLVLIEALAEGLPVVASRLGAIPDIIEDGITGLLFDPFDPADSVRTVRQALADPERLDAMGRAARAAYQCRYTADANQVALLEIYRDVLATHRQGLDSRP